MLCPPYRPKEVTKAPFGLIATYMVGKVRHGIFTDPNTGRTISRPIADDEHVSTNQPVTN